MAVLIMCCTGMRPGELPGINIATHLRSADTSAHFYTGSKTEAGRDRIIPTPLLILPLVQSLCDGRSEGPLVAAQSGKRFRLDTSRNRRFNPLMALLSIQGCTSYTSSSAVITHQKKGGASKWMRPRLADVLAKRFTRI